MGVYILLPCMLVSWALADLMFQFNSTIVIAALFLVTTPVQVSTQHSLMPIATYCTQTTLCILMYVRTYVTGCTHTPTHVIRTYISIWTHTHTSHVQCRTLVSGHTHTYTCVHVCMYRLTVCVSVWSIPLNWQAFVLVVMFICRNNVS